MRHSKLAAWMTGICLFLAAETSGASIFFIDEFTVTENDTIYWKDTFSDGSAPADRSVEDPAPVDVNPYGRAYLTRPLPGLPGPESRGKLELDTSKGHLNLGTVNPVMNRIQRARVSSSTNPAVKAALTATDRIKVDALFDLAQPEPYSLYGIRLTDWVSGSANEAIELAVRNTPDTGWVISLRQAEIGVQWHDLESWDLAAIPDILDFEQITLSLFNDPATGGSAFTAQFTLFDRDGGLPDQTFTSTATGLMFQQSGWLRPEFTARERYVPEPAVLMLIGIGLAAIGLARRHCGSQA